MSKFSQDESAAGLTSGRRGFLRCTAAVGAAAVLRPFPSFAESASGHARLPARGEFIIRNAYVVTMDEKLGDLPSGDIHVRNGQIIAVAPNRCRAYRAGSKRHCNPGARRG